MAYYDDERFYDDEGWDDDFYDEIDDELDKKGKKNSGRDGCFIATCVYGSYDCPQVWTLRRFRDQVLKASCLGRDFIRLYYAVSPKLVGRFGQIRWLRKVIRRQLNYIVRILNRRGFMGTPYSDSDEA